MKRFAPYVLLASLFFVVVVPFAMAAAKRTPTKPEGRYPGEPVATALSTVTGIAISPLLGAGAYGAYKWLAAEDDAARERLPWYAQMKFWLPALLVVAACAAKDSFGATLPPGWKKPLDVLETIENKFSALVAAGAVIPFAIDAMIDLLRQPEPTAMVPSLAGSGLALIQFGAIDFSWLMTALVMPFALAVFLLVWLASHAINVLILLSPWGAIDAALKAARTALFGLIAVTATIDPWIGAALSVVVIIVAYFVAGWAFRLTVFGTIFSWDFLTRKRTRFVPAENGNAMFAAAHFSGVPVRTYGRLMRRADGELEFVYRPGLILAPRSALVPAPARELAVGQGAIFSDVLTPIGQELFTLPPRYRGHEDLVARGYGLAGVRPAGLMKAWSALREMLGGRAAETGMGTPVHV